MPLSYEITIPSFTAPTAFVDPPEEPGDQPAGTEGLMFLEKFDSRKRTQSRDVEKEILKFVAMGSEDDVLIDTFANWAMPKYYRGLVLTEFTREHLGGGVWAIDGDYDRRAPTVKKRVRITTGGKTVRVVQGFGSVYSVAMNPDFDPDESITEENAPTMPGPNFGGLVGVTDSGVEGIDVPTPGLAFSVQIDFELIDQSFINLCHLLTGCVNSSTCMGFAAGELLFLGIDASYDIGTLGEILLLSNTVTFSFEAIPNSSNFWVGPFLIPFKRGWDYLWPRTVEIVSQDTVIRHTKSVHIDRVLRYADLNVLGVS